MEADLLHNGFTLEDIPQRVTLRAVRHFIAYARRGSAVYRQQRGEVAEWGNTEELLAKVLETLWDANWQRAGNRTAPRPKPLQRPGQSAPEGTQHFGKEPLSIADFERRMRERSAA